MGLLYLTFLLKNFILARLVGSSLLPFSLLCLSRTWTQNRRGKNRERG